MRFIIIIITTTMLCISLSACSGLRFPGVYRLTIQQGNIITQDMVDQLKPGMTKRQVNFVLGTPLVKDTFNNNRWDYLYTMRGGDGKISRRNLTVYFKGDKLTHFNGDYKPLPTATSTTQNTAENASSEAS